MISPISPGQAAVIKSRLVQQRDALNNEAFRVGQLSETYPELKIHAERVQHAANAVAKVCSREYARLTQIEEAEG